MTKKNLLDEQFQSRQGQSFWGRLRAYFLTGIFVTAPIAITIYLVWSFLAFIDTKMKAVVPGGFLETFSFPGVGLILAVVFFIAVGMIARNVFGRVIYELSDSLMDRVPVIRSIHAAVKQLLEAAVNGKSGAFREVVMFEFPRKGLWAMGFVTGSAKGEPRRTAEAAGGEDILTVFYPMTPPTSGFLLFIPRRDLRFLKMSTDEALKMIVSGGIIAPPGGEETVAPAEEIGITLRPVGPENGDPTRK